MSVKYCLRFSHVTVNFILLASLLYVTSHYLLKVIFDLEINVFGLSQFTCRSHLYSLSFFLYANTKIKTALFILLSSHIIVYELYLHHSYNL